MNKSEVTNLSPHDDNSIRAQSVSALWDIQGRWPVRWVTCPWRRPNVGHVSLLLSATSKSVRTIMSVQTHAHTLCRCGLYKGTYDLWMQTFPVRRSWRELLGKISCHLRRGRNSPYFQRSALYLSLNWLESLSVPRQEPSPLSFSSHSLIDHWSFWDRENRCDHHPNASSVRMCVRARPYRSILVCAAQLTFRWKQSGGVWKYSEWHNIHP